MGRSGERNGGETSRSLSSWTWRGKFLGKIAERRLGARPRPFLLRSVATDEQGRGKPCHTSSLKITSHDSLLNGIFFFWFCEAVKWK